MARQKLFSAIDIGTEKITTLIASQENDTKDVRILGVASTPAKGLRKSQIVDLTEAIESITHSVDAAERMAGTNIKSTFVSVSGTHIQSQNSKGVVAVAQPEHEITPHDVERVIDAAKAISLPSAREIIHVIPTNYTVDSQSDIKDPVGMSGVRLESQVHIITASSTALKNIARCVNEMGIEVQDFVFAGLSSSSMVLTETEKELGVVLVDIGAGSTSMSVYVEGSLMHSAVLPIGARHVTQDIALGVRISLESAETIKMALSNMPLSSPTALTGESKEDARKRKKKEDTINVRDLGITDTTQTLSKKTLIDGIMTPRMKEIFTLIGEELEKRDLFPYIPAGVVLTGGGAETAGIVEVCKKTLQLPTRIGVPRGFKGLIDEIEKPAFATSMGLLLYGSQLGENVESSGFSLNMGGMFSGIDIGGVGKKIVEFVKSVMP